MKTAQQDTMLPVVRAAELEEADHEHRWLVEHIVPRRGVAMIGGAPKCAKSWAGLDLALSLSSGTSCFGHFTVSEPAAALIYLAEDPAAVVKARLAGICRHRGLELCKLPIDVITVPVLRLDVERDRTRLWQTVRARRPRLLLLDPFVRLHRINENDAGEVSALLAYLRQIEREHDLAIVLVHHARKNGSAGAQAGQGLRGSGDFYAFVDSLLYLRRTRDQLHLTVEHRAAPAPPPIELALAGKETEIHLEIARAAAAPAEPVAANPHANLDARVLRVLEHCKTPVSRAAIRAVLHCRNQSIGEALTRLTAAGLAARQGELWARAARTPIEENGNGARRPATTRPGTTGSLF
jgi:RecA-family ATPase